MFRGVPLLITFGMIHREVPCQIDSFLAAAYSGAVHGKTASRRHARARDRGPGVRRRGRRTGRWLCRLRARGPAGRSPPGACGRSARSLRARGDRRGARGLAGPCGPAVPVLRTVRRQVRERALAVYDPVTERGLLRFVMMREGRHTGEAMVNIVGAAPDVERVAPVADALRARVPATASVVLNVNAKKASVAVGSEEHLL